MITGIVVALPEELSTLTKVKLNKGELHRLNDAITLGYSGAGRQNATRVAQLLVESGAKRLISWGCAAGLVTGVNPGDLVLASECMSADGKMFAVDSAWLDWASQTLLAVAIPVQSGKVAEAKGLVETETDKRELASSTGASALDMESVAVAKVAEANNLPYLVIRAIADPVDMTLPKSVGVALNGQGEVQMSKLFGHLLLHPGELPALLRLGRHFNAARKTLKQVARCLDQLTA